MKKLSLWLVVALLSISIVAVFSFAGCKKAEVAVGETVEEEAVEEAAVEEVAEEAASSEPKTIVYWTMFNEEEQDAKAIKKWIEDYKVIRPEITIEINFVGREVLTKAMVARGGGEVIDIIDLENYSLKGGLVKEGLALPMDEALDTQNFEGDTSWRDTFVPGTLEQYADEGKVFIIPYEIFSCGFAYDKKLWRDNGWTVPKAWDDFLALCETIKTTSDIAPITQDAGVDFYNIMWNYQIMEKLNGPGSIIEAAGDPTGEKWEDPSFKLAIEMERGLFDKGYFVEGCSGFTWPQGQSLLASREAAMELCGCWLHTELGDQVDDDFEWGNFPFPEIAGGKGKINDVESYLIGWAIYNDTEVASEAIDFLKFCTSKDSMQYYVDTAKFACSITAVDPPSEYGELGEALQNPGSLFSPHDGLPETYPDYHMNIYLKNHDLAFLGEITPDEYVTAMKEETIAYWENK